MLALVVARPGPVCDGLVALLVAIPDVRKIVQVAGAQDAWDFTQTLCPNITLIHASPLSSSLTNFVLQMKLFCVQPIVAIVNSEEDRQTAVSNGADVVFMEGLPSAKLAAHITIQLQQQAETKQC